MELEYLSLGAFIKQLQSFEEMYGEYLPVLLADKDSQNVMSLVIDSFVVDITNKDSGEHQKMVIVSNYTDDVNL